MAATYEQRSDAHFVGSRLGDDEVIPRGAGRDFLAPGSVQLSTNEGLPVLSSRFLSRYAVHFLNCQTLTDSSDFPIIGEGYPWKVLFWSECCMAKEQNTVDELLATKIREAVREPSRYKVLMHNDNFTTMDFVVHVLQNVFSKTPSEAVHIMLTIHKSGIASCGIYTAEIAETKIAAVHQLAEQKGFPLKCSMEEA